MDDRRTWGPQDPSVVSASAEEPPPPKRRGRRRAPLLAIATAVVLSVFLVGLVLVTGTGGGDRTDRLRTDPTAEGPSPAAVLAAAPAATRAGGTARVRTSTRTFEGGSAFKQVVEGVIGFDMPAFDLTYLMDASGGFLGTRGGGPFSERVFSDGTTVWSPLPPDAAFLPQAVAGSKTRRGKDPFKGKKYVAYQTGESTGSPASGMEAFGQTALGFSIGSAPADVLGYLSTVGTAVEEGTEQLDGEEVTRYGVQLDLDALQRGLPSDERTFDAYDFKPNVPHTFPGSVWLDRQGRLRKLTYRLDLAMLLTEVALKADYQVEECAEPDPALLEKAEAGDPKAMAALARSEESCTQRPPRPEELLIEGSVELSGYGTALTITPPPAGEVVSSKELDAFFEAQVGEMFPLPPATTIP